MNFKKEVFIILNRVGKERRNNLNKHQLKNDENKFEKENKIKSKKFKRIKYKE